MALGVAAIVGLFPMALGRGVVDDPVSAAPVPSSRPSSTPTTSAPPPPLQVVVIGDDLAIGAAEDTAGTSGWSRLVESGLRSDGLDVTVDVAASEGSGYTAAGQDGTTFRDRAGAVPPGSDLVVFVGGANDEAGIQAVEDAAYAAYLDVWEVNADAYMLVVGPATPGAEPTPVVRTTRQGVLAASQRAGLTFADPFREEWFTGAEEEFFSEDGSRLTPAGQERMAERLLPLVREQTRQVLRDPSVDLDD